MVVFNLEFLQVEILLCLSIFLVNPTTHLSDAF